MSSSVGLEPAIPGLEAGCSTNLATESLVMSMILKVLFMFISMIFGRPARKGCFLYGKIVAHSQVSMDKAIYGQNGMGVLTAYSKRDPTGQPLSSPVIVPKGRASVQLCWSSHKESTFLDSSSLGALVTKTW